MIDLQIFKDPASQKADLPVPGRAKLVQTGRKAFRVVEGFLEK